MIEGRQHDAGEVKEGETVEVTYALRNAGNETLVVSDVRPRCETCMEVTMKERRLPPGGTGTLEVEYQAVDVTGKFVRYIVIETNDPADRQVSVILRGEVLPEFTVRPETLDFGQVRGEPVSKTVIVQRNFGGVPVVHNS